MRYASAPDEELIRVPLDSLTALYHRRSGQTHLLAAPLPEILDALGAEPLDIAALLAVLGIDDNEEARELANARLSELLDTGLVASV